MRTVINIGEVMFDIADKSHAECLAAFPDPEERYRYEAGTDRRDAVLRCLETALSALDVALEEYTAGPHTYVGTNSPYLTDADAVVYEFPGSARRFSSQAGAVARLLHSVIVGRTLALFDAMNGRADAAQGWAALAAADTEGILKCMRTKTMPIRTKPYTV